MKVVHIIIGLNIGGAELFLYRLVLNSKCNYNYTVISLTDLGVIGQKLLEQGVKVHVLKMQSIFSIFIVIKRLYKLLKLIRPDVVQTWMYHADCIGGVVAKYVGVKKIIWSIRTTDVSKGRSRATIYLRKLCAILSHSIPTHIVYAAYAAKNIHNTIGYNTSKGIVISNGFELENFCIYPEDRVDFRKEIGIREDEILIGSIGRFNKIKNQKLFIEIAQFLITKLSNLKFVMIGRDNSPDNRELMSWIKERKLEPYFILLDQRSDIVKCLSGLDLFCLHSKTEGFPNILGEAMAVGTLSVSVDVGDASYLLKNPELITSEVFLAEKIYQVISWDTDKKRKTIENAKLRIKENFDLQLIINKYTLLYQKED